MSAAAAAFFDVDGTITKTNILDPLIWFQRAHLSRLRFSLFALGLLARVPYFLWTDRRSRGRFNVVFYRRYAGLNATGVRDWHRRTFADNLQRTIFLAALDCIRDHQRQGHRIVFVTGGLDLVMQPLADFVKADELIGTRLVERDGVITGEIVGLPIADECKATLVREYALRQGIDLAESYAYGNSMGDAPMLECVGHAIAVNPDGRLRELAGKRNWRAVQWAS